MQYFGGKQRIAKYIVPILQNCMNGRKCFFEPFVGGANIVSKITGNRVASDANKYLIALYQALQQGWVPPDTVTEEDYHRAKNGDYSDYLRAFIGFGCSFAGKWFGGYARGNESRNYALNAKNSLLQKLKGLHGVVFLHRGFSTFKPEDCLIYCDPPYIGSTKYGGIDDFDHQLFWQTVQQWSVNNTVFVSEYESPLDCEIVWQKDGVTDIRGKQGRLPVTEKLFQVRP